MKLTKQQLKQIIKEEMEAVLREEEEEEAFEIAAANAYEAYAKEVGADINHHKPEEVPAGIDQNLPDGGVRLPRWARTGSFERHMRAALKKQGYGGENLSYEQIKDAILSGLSYRGE